MDASRNDLRPAFTPAVAGPCGLPGRPAAWRLGPLPELEGFDADHKVEGVTFEDIHVNGQRIKQQDPALFKGNPFTGSITVK